MATKGTVLGGGGYASGGAQRFVLAFVDLDAPTPVASPMPLDFLAHGVSLHPRDPTRAAVFEKKGPGRAGGFSATSGRRCGRRCSWRGRGRRRRWASASR